MTDVSLPAERFAEGEFRAGRVLNRTFSVLGRNLLPFCLVTAVAGLPNVLLVGQQTAAAGSGRMAGWMFLGIAISVVLNALSQAIVLYAAFQDMRGLRVNLIESMKIGLRRFFPVLGVAISAAILTGLASILLLVPGIIVYTMVFVAMPVCVVERLGPWKSMARSATLTKGHRWKIFGLALVVMLVGLIVVVAGGFAAAMVAIMLKSFAAGSVPLSVLARVFSFLWTAVWSAFYVIMVVVTYHDLRVAKEGVDTDQIVAVFD